MVVFPSMPTEFRYLNFISKSKKLSHTVSIVYDTLRLIIDCTLGCPKIHLFP